MAPQNLCENRIHNKTLKILLVTIQNNRIKSNIIIKYAVLHIYLNLIFNSRLFEWFNLTKYGIYNIIVTIFSKIHDE